MLDFIRKLPLLVVLGLSGCVLAGITWLVIDQQYAKLVLVVCWVPTFIYYGIDGLRRKARWENGLD